MRNRCLNRRSPDYPDYGGRGIFICARWASFEAFLADMGPPPPGRSLGRIDNDGPYTPENCRWETAFQQSGNRRGLRWITFNGKTQILSDWAREAGITVSTLSVRLDSMGWPLERALLSGNQRGLRWITYNGRTQILSDWAREIGINRKTLQSRLDLMRWPLEKALTT